MIITRHTSPPQISAALDRLAAIPTWVLLTQLFIGLGWTRAVVEKLIDPTWWTGAHLRAFLTEHESETIGWYQPMVANVIEPAAIAVAVTVIALQALTAASLLTGRRLTVGLALGMAMNVNFIAVGAVSPSVFYLLAQGAVLLWLLERRNSLPGRAIATATIIAVVLAVGSAPWIATLHPAEVIHDPALMMVTAGSLAALMCGLLHRRLVDEPAAP